jgi:hypothetical protein
LKEDEPLTDDGIKRFFNWLYTQGKNRREYQGLRFEKWEEEVVKLDYRVIEESVCSMEEVA